MLLQQRFWKMQVLGKLRGGAMNGLARKAIFGFLLLLCSESRTQEWVKPSGRTEYVWDRSACVQEAQSKTLAGEAFDRDIADCLVNKGWQRN
jgi:hypothetical protein